MKMSLKQKGAFRPPPVLAEPFERVSQALQAWPRHRGGDALASVAQTARWMARTSTWAMRSWAIFTSMARSTWPRTSS